MASFNPFVNLNSGHKPWVDQISQTLQTQLQTTIDSPPISIFEISKTLKTEKLEAYVPQHVGLGPAHHFHPELYRKMEQKKLNAAKRLLKPLQIQDCQELVKKVEKIVPIARAYYDFFLDFDNETLAWLFAIDGMFLLEQIYSYPNQRFVTETNDFIMLENQIPLIVLTEIQEAISGENILDRKDYLESKFRFMCKPHSPFHLANENVDFSRVNHLLDFMYHSIVNNGNLISRNLDFANPESDQALDLDAKVELLEAVIKSTRLIPGAPTSPQIIEFVKKKFPGFIKEVVVKEIKVPSVSDLFEIARVRFRLSPRNEGIRNIKFVQEQERICYLPFINLNVDSEVILRNLVAYEKFMARNSFTTGYGLELTEYVDFMCGIIDTANDVKLLRKAEIIQGDLEDNEIVKLFNGIAKSGEKMRVETELREVVTQLNKVYESTPRVRVRRLVEKHMHAWAKIITFLVSISCTSVMVREVYLKAYGLKPLLMKLVDFFRLKFGQLLVFFVNPKGPDVFV